MIVSLVFFKVFGRIHLHLLCLEVEMYFNLNWYVDGLSLYMSLFLLFATPPKHLTIQCSHIGFLVHFWVIAPIFGASTHPFFCFFLSGWGWHYPLFISVKIMCTIGKSDDTMSLDNSYISCILLRYHYFLYALMCEFTDHSVDVCLLYQ